ncbi:MAG: acyl-CoA thioesterase [Kiritimatiellae bacterium]|nr:acyl-CoA thioesterase [Kiritimatiellia bacterium]
MKAGKVLYRVPYADTDQMGVVYYGNYLRYFEMARNELMRECGWAYKDFERDGFMLPVVHAEVDYRKSARYDDLVEISAFYRSNKGVRLEISCEVRCNGELLAAGFTRHVFVDASTFKPVAPPPRFIDILKGL